MKASELIVELERLISLCGDRDVYLPAYDYPERMRGS